MRDDLSQTSEMVSVAIRTIYFLGLICIHQGFLGRLYGFNIVRIKCRISFVDLLASSSMVDATPMCICPCNATSTRSQSISLLYRSTSGGISESSTSDQSSPFFDVLTTTAGNTNSDSSSSSICYCPCSTTSSTSHILCKYAH